MARDRVATAAAADRERADGGEERDAPALGGGVQFHHPSIGSSPGRGLRAVAELPTDGPVLQTAGMHRLDGKIALGHGRGPGNGRGRSPGGSWPRGHGSSSSTCSTTAGRAVAAELGDAARFVHLDVTDEAAWSRVVDGVGAPRARCTCS